MRSTDQFIIRHAVTGEVLSHYQCDGPGGPKGAACVYLRDELAAGRKALIDGGLRVDQLEAVMVSGRAM